MKPAEFRASVELLIASAYDNGMTAGYAKLPRNTNPFLPAQKVATKGKAR